MLSSVDRLNQRICFKVGKNKSSTKPIATFRTKTARAICLRISLVSILATSAEYAFFAVMLITGQKKNLEEKKFQNIERERERPWRLAARLA
jgi:hypothetical protein